MCRSVCLCLYIYIFFFKVCLSCCLETVVFLHPRAFGAVLPSCEANAWEEEQGCRRDEFRECRNGCSTQSALQVPIHIRHPFQSPPFSRCGLFLLFFAIICHFFLTCFCELLLFISLLFFYDGGWRSRL